ncbi:MAG: hypothetical protein ACREK1_00910 [Longimicrobiales bacterium]
MFELKLLSREGVEAALQKAERYRLLNEAWQAESICRDVLRIEPDNQRALTTLILALTDQFRTEGAAHGEEARALLSQLTSEYARAYYAGIICERRGMAYLNRNTPGAGFIAYDWLRKAMQWYEQAEALRQPGSEDALLRWNTCARVIDRDDSIQPAPELEMPDQLE